MLGGPSCGLEEVNSLVAFSITLEDGESYRNVLKIKGGVAKMVTK